MNERLGELYAQAMTLAVEHVPMDHQQFHPITAACFASLIIKESASLFEVEYGTSELSGDEVGSVLRLHFGIEP